MQLSSCGNKRWTTHITQLSFILNDASSGVLVLALRKSTNSLGKKNKAKEGEKAEVSQSSAPASRLYTVQQQDSESRSNALFHMWH